MNAQDLKNSILQLAIQGKLVEQREEEGTAKKLLEKIEAKKKHLIKEGKIKKQKELPEIKEDEIPFDIPESWEWARLNDVFNFIDYRGKTPTKITSGIVLITASNIKKGYLDFSKADFISETDYNERQSRGITKKGDILFTTEAPLGNVAINTLNIASAGQRAITFQQYGENIFLNELICYFIQSPHFQFELINNATGTTAKGIKAARLKGLMIPFPPLEEQKRIVAKIEELLPHVDKYDAAYSEVEDLNKNFPEDMQKSILQYAVKGKLVEQREEDETAEDLYKQIQEEKRQLIKEDKVKKTKKLPEITEDEMPFDIPENWKWVNLEHLAIINGGYAFKSSNYTAQGIRVIRISDFNERGFVNNKLVRHPYDDSLDMFLLEKNNILLCMTGGTVGKSLFVKEINEPMMTNQRVATIKIRRNVNPDFINYVILSPIIQSIIRSSKNSTNDNISMSTIKKFPIPLPPLEEQKRIVAKIEELLPHTQRLVK